MLLRMLERFFLVEFVSAGFLLSAVEELLQQYMCKTALKCGFDFPSTEGNIIACSRQSHFKAFL